MNGIQRMCGGMFSVYFFAPVLILAVNWKYRRGENEDRDQACTPDRQGNLLF